MSIVRRSLIATICAAIILPLIADTALAHRVPLVQTTIVQSDENLAITHRLHAHDAVKLLNTLTAEQPDITVPKNQARLALAVSQRFLLTDDDTFGDIPEEANIIGAEIEGNYLFIYQELNMLGAPSWWVKSDILKTISSNWLNSVNIEHGKNIKTLTFSGTSKWQAIND